MKLYNATIVSAFPGTGKSHWFRKMQGSDIKVLDSDSSAFDKAEFPANYIRHIQDNMGKADVILVSSHKEVRDALNDVGIYYNLAYPDQSLKAEYTARYAERGSPESFIKVVDANWDAWIAELKGQPGCAHRVLNAGEYLGDWLDGHVVLSGDSSF